MSRTTIVLADDHFVVRKGLRTVLEAEPEFSVVGEATDGLEAAQLAEELTPDVLILDLMMPGLNGLDVARQVHQRCPRTRMLILSMYADEGYVMQALRNGAAGYILKETRGLDLIGAVREVAAGRHYLGPPLSERAIELYLEKAEASSLDLHETLSTREREVLQLAAEGYPSSAIAARLGISPRTAETHRANMMRKLDLQSQTDLIRYALRRGILPMDK
jgi:two-component system, NarL family, response regulator NreC